MNYELFPDEDCYIHPILDTFPDETILNDKHLCTGCHQAIAVDLTNIAPMAPNPLGQSQIQALNLSPIHNQKVHNTMTSFNIPSTVQTPLPNSPKICATHIECWLHGCKGRIFSSISNYRRHCKERNGIREKPVCPTCGRVFTRKLARDQHFEQLRCRVTLADGNGVPFKQPLFQKVV
jgi:hypothetical protein